MQPGSTLVASYQQMPQHQSSISSAKVSGSYKQAVHTYMPELPQLKLDARPKWDDRNVTNSSSNGNGVSILVASSDQNSFQLGGGSSRRYQH